MTNRALSTYDITLGAMFVALMAIGANITAVAPFLSVMGVPLTLQTFFAILAGLILGSRLGTIAMTVYLALGLVGAPVFAGFKAGFSVLVMPTFGFILSFILLAFVVGKIAEKNRRLNVYITAASVGLLINYAIGVNWMYGAYVLWVGEPESFSYLAAWAGMGAFFVKDAVLAVCAGMLANRLVRTGASRAAWRRNPAA
ncbi:biotin transporter BioY [Thalassobacillus sp. CUG 92003]|uniref:biotin transporter BioY n=1 Tax=Thalassobacillus sp. CUG 92003 TaxID=2736641 RepID=UPI0015E76A54|nr:biotin transporter BioY [Thalassobacillus sp. CUG 92003]